MKISHPFDYLRLWDSWDDTKIENSITQEALEKLQEAVNLLDDETKIEKFLVNRENFVLLVRDMHDLMKSGSIMLSKAMVEAGSFEDNKEYEKAIKRYEDFLTICKSKFYRDITRGYLRELNKNME